MWYLVTPEIVLPVWRMGQSQGRYTILDCRVTAFPQAVVFWQKGGKPITSSNKHKIEAYAESDHTLTLSLRLARLEYMHLMTNIVMSVEVHALVITLTEITRLIFNCRHRQSFQLYYFNFKQCKKPAQNQMSSKPSHSFNK